MGLDGEQITIRERKSSLGESLEDLKRKSINRRSQKCLSQQYSSPGCDIAEEDSRFFLSSDYEGEGELRVGGGGNNRSDELLKKLMHMAKEMSSSIDTKYKLKVKKKPELKEHLLACAALRKLFLQGECNEKAPLNPVTKTIWKKWKELSEESKHVSDLKMKELLIDHAEAGIKIFMTDPDFSGLIQKNSTITEFKTLLEQYKSSLHETSTSSGSSRPSMDKKPTHEEVIGEADVDAHMKQFTYMQTKVTKSYLELMTSLKTRWTDSGNDVMSRENVAKKTREDLLSVQDQLVKYQNSLVMYQADINSLWQCMIEHQQAMNNDFQWDFVESVNGDDVNDIGNGYSRKQKKLHKRVSRFFAKKFGKGKKK
ncbi:uncharacterized protein LOC134842084 isoform X2 [Symsagittifera roscoffensis]